MSTSEHDALHELSGLYALGALREEDRAAFEAHVRTCADCRREVESFVPIVAGLAHAVPDVLPPSALRNRVLTAISGKDAGGVPASRRTGGASARAGWLAAAAGFLLAATLGYTTLDRQQHIRDLEARLRDVSARAAALETQVADARRETGVAQTRVDILTAADVARIDLVGEPAAPSARGRAHWSRSNGLLFSASNLPVLPPGRVYQLWVVTDQAPISAGLVRPDASGNVSVTFQTPPDLPQPLAMALTIEPEGGVPAPTGPRYLIGTPTRDV